MVAPTPNTHSNPRVSLAPDSLHPWLWVPRLGSPPSVSGHPTEQTPCSSVPKEPRRDPTALLGNMAKLVACAFSSPVMVLLT